MDFDTIKREWRAAANYDGGVQRQIWDRVAADYGEKPLPSLERDPFLRHLQDSFPLERTMRALDIGCGAGSYSMALSPVVGEAIGVDISPNMIACANRRAAALGLFNTAFSAVDWCAADLEDLGFTGAFDLVFAHTTPAVCDFETFDKLNRCARQFCLYEKPTRRRDSVQNAAFQAIGLPTGQVDLDIPYLFAYLWHRGYEPAFWYRKETWQSHRTIADACAWCIDRARLCKPLSAEEEAAMRSCITARAEDGVVHETTETMLVTIAWRVDNG